MIEATVWGGAGEHGRSSYYLKNNGTSVLLDCGGKKQGMGEYPLIDREAAANVDAVFLSHAHEDHSAALPLLYRAGYAGLVWTTRETAAQLPGYFAAWQKYVRSRQGQLPYEAEDVARIRYAFVEDAAAPGEWFSLSPSLRACWGRSGHMLGSIWLMLELAGSVVFFSGDYSDESLLLAADQPMLPQDAQDVEDGGNPVHNRVELALIDAAYGMDREAQGDKLTQLHRHITRTAANRGKVLLPVPAGGRGQELLVWLTEEFPDVPLLVETKIADGLTQLLQKPEWLQPQAIARIQAALNTGHITSIRDEADRKQQLAHQGPCLILTDDGMMQSDKAQWYYHALCEHPEHSIVLSGHVAQGTFGQQLLQKPLAGQACDVRAIRYKVHQGIENVRRMLRRIDSVQTVLVHAEQKATDAVVQSLRQEGFTGLHSLYPGAVLPLTISPATTKNTASGD